ncbi:MAG: hypothetical protein KDB22_17680 [Planctomycetales bacterium]|nr:hypothetical protein [Planctomycetales bacterium]
MNNQTLQKALKDLPLDRDGPSALQVRQLGLLVDGDLPLQTFLERLLPELVQLFHAQAAVAWMKAEGASGAVFGVRYRMDALLNSVAEHKKHDRLVQLAWRHKQPLLAEPASKQDKQATPSHDNPTGCPVLFGPILHLGEPIALLEVVLSEARGPFSPAQRQLFLRGIQLISERVYGGLSRRMTLPAATIAQATRHLELLTNEVNSLQQQILRNIELRLQQFHGWAFASYDENQSFAKLVQQLLESHGLRVRCPECGNPAILRCLRSGNAKHGAFVFDHYLDTGRTFHGGPTTVPLIQVVAKPARRPAISNPA